MDDKKNTNKENALISALKDVGRHFEKMSDAIHQFSEVYKENTHRLPYLKTKECWSFLLIVSTLVLGFLSLRSMGKDALSLVKAYNIRTQMAQIQKFKTHENKAVDKARTIVINQTIDCPIQGVKKLKEMQKARNNTLTDIAAYSTGLPLREEAPIRRVSSDIVSEVFNIGLHEICKVNSDAFDEKTKQQIDKINRLANKSLLDLEKQLSELKF